MEKLSPVPVRMAPFAYGMSNNRNRTYALPHNLGVYLVSTGWHVLKTTFDEKVD